MGAATKVVTMGLIGMMIFPPSLQAAYVTRNVPQEYDAEENVTEEKTIIDVREPYFPSGKEKIKIAIMPFTGAGSTDAGAETSSEIEFRLLKQIEFFKSSNESAARARFNEMLTQKNYYSVNDIYAKWRSRNKVERYEVLNREQISALMTEKSIKYGGEITPELIRSNNSILGVDCFITGHTRRLNQNDVSFIMKATSARTSKVFFTERFEGDYETAFNKAVETFFFNIKEVKTETVTFAKKVKKTRYVQTQEWVADSTRSKSGDEGCWQLIGIVGLIVIIAIIANNAPSNPSQPNSDPVLNSSLSLVNF